MQYDGKLVEYYSQFGFEEYKREANWTPGEPDLAYMRLNPDKYEQFKTNNPEYYTGEGNPVFERNFRPNGRGLEGIKERNISDTDNTARPTNPNNASKVKFRTN